MAKTLKSTCCVTGGGPAGMMLGYLLARAGVDVVVLEKHPDFLRDFRGDTVHPSTLEIMHELGLLEEFLALPHQEARTLKAHIGDEEFTIADFSHLPTVCKFIALMPQWDFLNFLSGKAKAFPNFTLLMRTEATGLIEENGRVAGITATSPEGDVKIRADLTVAADGRHSTLRAASGLKVQEAGAPIDVLWMRISRKPDDPEQPMGRFDKGILFVMIYRGDYWQCAFVIEKGGIARVKAEGLEAFKHSISEVAPFLGERVNEIQSWDQVKLLTVTIDHLTRWWRDGLLCIGDAAHAMSPVGGVGINLAIQDAVAAANILAVALREKRVTTDYLEEVQERRTLPTQAIQRIQVLVQDRIISRALQAKERTRAPLFLRLLLKLPFFRRIPARIVGLGVRPEHVDKSIFLRK